MPHDEFMTAINAIKAQLSHACYGKFSFDTHHIAAKVAKRQRGNCKLSLDVYQCRGCSAWHIGRNPNK